MAGIISVTSRRQHQASMRDLEKASSGRRKWLEEEEKNIEMYRMAKSQ
jgi:hypothetical protein